MTLELLKGVIYYLSCAIENGNEAAELAADHDLQVQVLFPKDLPLPSDALALIVDLDYLWLDARGRRDFLAELIARPPAVLTYVHSYDFDDGEDSGLKNVI